MFDRSTAGATLFSKTPPPESSRRCKAIVSSSLGVSGMGLRRKAQVSLKGFLSFFNRIYVWHTAQAQECIVV